MDECSLRKPILHGRSSRLTVAVAGIAVTLIAAGCTARQAYNTGQAWQRNECNKLIDVAERERCLRGTNTPYEDYRRAVEDAKTP